MNENTLKTAFDEYALHSEELRQLEAQVLQCAKRNRYKEGFCANNAWYGTFKRKVCELSGWYAKDERLRTTMAYEAVYRYLYSLLPNCNHDSMCWVHPGSEDI
jgi:hypothetical protein